MKDYYSILELDQNCSMDEIKQSYRRLALKYHPDRSREDKEIAEQKFKDIGEAYSILSNPKKRKHYDRQITTTNNIVNNDIEIDNLNVNPFQVFSKFFNHHQKFNEYFPNMEENPFDNEFFNNNNSGFDNDFFKSNNIFNDKLMKNIFDLKRDDYVENIINQFKNHNYNMNDNNGNTNSNTNDYSYSKSNSNCMNNTSNSYYSTSESTNYVNGKMIKEIKINDGNQETYIYEKDGVKEKEIITDLNSGISNTYYYDTGGKLLTE